MKYECIDCIDAGSEFCPCHLAEAGECILCSQLHGKKFCDCLNWKGVCIYQEFSNNAFKAKENRKTFNCPITDIKLLEEEVIQISFSAPHKLCIDLYKPGAFIFIRGEENCYFDVPISVMDSDIDNNIITIMVEMRGIKTKRLKELKVSENLIIRAPYWNGVFGLKNVVTLKNSYALVTCRGIGMAPMLPVIKKLINNENKVKVLIDKAPFKDIYVRDYLIKWGVEFQEINMLSNGELSVNFKSKLSDEINSNPNIGLIHCAGADILTYNVLNYLDEIAQSTLPVSCCNNSKMCCGEGVCGSCTARFSGHRVRRLCKVQSDPRTIFEGRRFI